VFERMQSILVESSKLIDEGRSEVHDEVKVADPLENKAIEHVD
jgi:hypothetical protein